MDNSISSSLFRRLPTEQFDFENGSPDAIAKQARAAFHQGRFIAKTVIDGGRIVKIESEEMLSRFLTKGYTLRLNAQGLYFLSPPGLCGGAPQVNMSCHHTKITKVLNELRGSLNQGNFLHSDEKLLFLKSLITFSNYEIKDGMIINFMQEVLKLNQIKNAPPSLRAKLFHFLKFLSLSNLHEKSTKGYRELFYDDFQRILKDQEEALLKTKFKAGPLANSELFHHSRALYELSVAKMLLSWLFPKNNLFHKEDKVIDFSSFIGPFALKGILGERQGIADCVKAGLKSGVEPWVQAKEEERFKKLFALEVMNHIALNSDLNGAEALALVKEVIAYFKMLKAEVKNDDFILLYSCLDCIYHLAVRFPTDEIEVDVYQLLFNQIKSIDALVAPLISFGEVTITWKMRYELKLIEMAAVFNSSKSKISLCYSGIIDEIKKKKLTHTVTDDLLKEVTRSVPLFTIDDSIWLKKIDALYKSIKPQDLEKFKEKRRDEIFPLLSEEVKASLGGLQISYLNLRLHSPDLYLLNLCSFAVAVREQVFITSLYPDVHGKVPSVEEVNQPKGLSFYKADDFSSSSRSESSSSLSNDNSIGGGWELDPSDMKRKNDDPNELAKIALDFLENPDMVLTIPQSLFCINEFIEMSKRLAVSKEKRDLAMMIGTTGSGKSTTSNFLLGHEMVKVISEESSRPTVDVKNKTAGDYFIVGHEGSKTFMPQVVSLPGTGLSLCDTAGILDTRPIMRVVNGASLTHMVDKSKSLRILLVIEFNSFDNVRGLALKETFNHLKEMFGSLHILTQNLPSILFCITKSTPDAIPASMAKKLFKVINELCVGQKLDPSLEQVILNQLVFVNPLDPAQRQSILDRCMNLPSINETNNLFNVTLDEKCLAQLRKITQALGAQMEDLFEKKEYARVAKCLDQLDYIKNVDKVEGEKQLAELKAKFELKILNLIADIRSLVYEPSFKRSELKSKMPLLYRINVLAPQLSERVPDLPDTYIQINKEVLSFETKVQGDINVQLEDNYKTLYQLISKELSALVESEPQLFQKLSLVKNGAFGLTKGLESLVAPAMIKVLKGELSKEEGNREHKFYCGNIFTLRTLNDKIETEMDLLVFESIVKAKMALIARDFVSALSELQGKLPKMVEHGYALYYQNIHTLTTFDDLVSDPYETKAATQALTQVMGRCKEIYTVKDDLSPFAAQWVEKTFADYFGQIDTFFKVLHTKSKEKKIELTTKAIDELNKDPATLKEQALNDLFAILREVDEEVYAQKVAELRLRWVEDPKTLIQKEIDVPSAEYVFHIASALTHIKAASKIPHLFSGTEQGEALLADCTGAVLEREESKRSQEITLLERTTELAISQLEALQIEALQNHKFNIFGTMQVEEPVLVVNHFLKHYPSPLLTSKPFQELNAAVRTENQRYYYKRNALVQLQSKTQTAFKKLVYEGKIEEEKAKLTKDIIDLFQQLLPLIDPFLEKNAQTIIHNFSWEELKRLSFAPRVMEKIDQIERSSVQAEVITAVKEKRGKCIKILLDEIEKKAKKAAAKQISASIDETIKKERVEVWAEKEDLKGIFDRLERLDQEEYQKALGTFNTYLLGLHKDKVNPLLKSGAFPQVVSYFKLMLVLQEKIGGRLTLNVTSLVTDIEAYLEDLYKNALVEIKVENTLDTKYFSVENLEKYLDFNRSLDTELHGINFISFIPDLEKQYGEILENMVKGIKEELLNPAEYHLTLDKFAKVMVKNMAIAAQLSQIEKCLTAIKGGIKLLTDNESKYHLGKKIKGLMAAHSEVAIPASKIIDSVPVFKMIDWEVRNKMAGGVTFEEALQKMECEPAAERSDERLTKIYEYYRETYGAYINDILKNCFDKRALISRTEDLAKELKPHAEELYRSPENLGRLLACIFAGWSYSSIPKDYEINENTTLLQPHKPQILAILRLLGADNASGKIQNHILEVMTGEGKSVCLGATATLFALLDYDVDVVCHNPYLSNRDHELFSPLFRLFNVRWNIDYKPIHDLFSSCTNRNLLPNRNSYVKRFLKGEEPVPFKEDKSGKRLLLIDEVDIFFGPDFYDKSSGIIELLREKESKAIVRYVWDHRDQSLSVDKVMELPECEELIKIYPNLREILKKEIRKMLGGIISFPMGREPYHQCVRKDNKIGYPDATSCETNFHTYYGDYSTQFAYFYYRETGEITSDEALENPIGIMVHCGHFAYSKLPLFYDLRLGMTGTLKELSPDESKILTEFEFKKRSYIPTTFSKKQKTEIDETLVVDGGEEEYFQALKGALEKCVKDRRSALVIFEGREDLEKFRKQLAVRPGNLLHSPEILIENQSGEYGKTDASVYRATLPQTITFMIKQYGRGTDFVCRDSALIRAGGVQVISTIVAENKAEERQNIGRTARQGEPGNYRKILSAQYLIDEKLVPIKSVSGVEAIDYDEIKKSGKTIDDIISEKRTQRNAEKFKKREKNKESSLKSHDTTIEMLEAFEKKEQDKSLKLLLHCQQ